MSAPKASNSTALSLHAALPAEVSFFDTLIPFIKRNKNKQISSSTVEKHENTIRHAISFYIGAIRATPTKTVGKRKGDLKKIDTAARKLLAAIEDKEKEKIKKWNDKLYELWTSWDSKQSYTVDKIQYKIGISWDTNMRSFIYQRLNNPPKDSLALAKELTAFSHALRDYKMGSKHSDQTKRLLKALVGLHKDFAQKENALKGTAMRLKEPHLANLLYSLIPVWIEITGYTLRLKNKSAVQDNPFALWVQSLLVLAKAERPLVSTIVSTANKILK